MKIAIVGTGISGLTCARLLDRAHDLTLYEAEDWIGGHTHTVDIVHEGRSLAVDTGFIVFNTRNYPGFDALMRQMGVESRETKMSFGVRDDATGLEYGGENLASLFAQKRNFLSPKFHRMIRGILRFNREAPRDVLESGEFRNATLGEYLDAKAAQGEGFDPLMIERFLIPMTAAVWSSPLERSREMPATFFVRFFLNHGMLQVRDRPRWRTISGGSREYVRRLTRDLRARVRPSTPVQAIRRIEGAVEIRSRGEAETFDRVIIACHSDQALRMLDDPTRAEREILGAIPYQANDVILHTDRSILPKRKAAWSAWNFLLTGRDEPLPIATYNMTTLQRLPTRDPVLVSLNASDRIDPSKVLGRWTYHHPAYTTQTIDAQKRWHEINAGSTHYCGAYWAYGFHEDGVQSALRVCAQLGRGLDGPIDPGDFSTDRLPEQPLPTVAALAGGARARDLA